MTVSGPEALYRIALPGAVYVSYAISPFMLTAHLFINVTTPLYFPAFLIYIIGIFPQTFVESGEKFKIIF